MTVTLVTLFAVGYAAIVFEHLIRVNKTATALFTGVVLWVVWSLSGAPITEIHHELSHHLKDIAEIIFFLLGAMTIVEVIDAHDGFEIITTRIQTSSKRKLLWIVGFITFALSPILDNLTTAVVMITLVRKLIQEPKDRMLFGGLIVIAANSGGAWSPMGDVT
ncbi:MAG: sodium:proton antiporter, partial [Spirochaetia bacterium]|nr:sodium:proton antiporter [Spirochaetia bacterium]